MEGEKVDEIKVKQNESKLQKLTEKSIKYDQVLEKWYPKDKLIYYEDLKHMYAFVVFEDPRDMRKAKWSLKSWNCHLFTWKYLFWKRFKLTAVDTADSPSNIIWENLEVGFIESFLRSFLTFFIVIICLIISFGIIYCLKAYQNNGLPNSQDCKFLRHITKD